MKVNNFHFRRGKLYSKQSRFSAKPCVKLKLGALVFKCKCGSNRYKIKIEHEAHKYYDEDVLTVYFQNAYPIRKFKYCRGYHIHFR